MIRLAVVPKEPFWLELMHGARWKVRPLTTAIYEAARSRSASLVAELRTHVEEIRAVGGDVTGLIDFDDAEEAAGFQRQCFFQAMAVAAVVEWEGIVDDDSGEPAAVTEENILHITTHLPGFVQDFMVKYSAPYDRLVDEGNGLPAAVTGTSSPAAAGTTAATADTSTSLAPGESEAPAENAVPT